MKPSTVGSRLFYTTGRYTPLCSLIQYERALLQQHHEADWVLVLCLAVFSMPGLTSHNSLLLVAELLRRAW